MTLGSLIALATVTVGTWNGEWFPSGRAEHRAAPEIEAATIQVAGQRLRRGLDAADPTGTNDVILCLNEIRGPRVAEELCRAVGRTNLAVAVVTGYRRRDRYDQQQDVVATTLPVVSADWEIWRPAKRETPPRGFARARVVFSSAVTGTVYAVHLKSNYGQSDETAALNRAKRTRAIRQLVEEEPSVPGRVAPVVIAGDFNADRWQASFAEETLFADLEAAGFVNALALMPDDRRFTHPGRGKWPNSALDYVMLRGLAPLAPPVSVSAEGVSDHNPVFVTVDVEPRSPTML